MVPLSYHCLTVSVVKQEILKIRYFLMSENTSHFSLSIKRRKWPTNGLILIWTLIMTQQRSEAWHKQKEENQMERLCSCVYVISVGLDNLCQEKKINKALVGKTKLQICGGTLLSADFFVYYWDGNTLWNAQCKGIMFIILYLYHLSDVFTLVSQTCSAAPLTSDFNCPHWPL